jgi:hypothetical protein
MISDLQCHGLDERGLNERLLKVGIAALCLHFATILSISSVPLV